MVCKWGDGVYECVGEVTVVLTEPQQGCIHDLFEVKVNKICADNFHNGFTQISVAIGVITDLLDYLAGG